MSNPREFMVLTEKQQYALKFIGKGKSIFYGGARGGGKTHLALNAAVLTAKRYPKIKVVAIRETYPELEEAFIGNLLEKYPERLFKYKYKDKTRTASFENGSKILFRACDNEDSARKIRGLEFQLMIIDEANNLDYGTIERLRGSLRRTNDLVGFLPTLLMTGNPGGRSDLFFKTHFINPDYKRWDANELKYKDNYIYIPANVYDNPYLGEEYVQNLESLSDDLRRAWLDGDWNVYEGQFFMEWETREHVVPYFNIPDDWDRKAAIDLGYTKKHPTVALFAAQDPIYRTLYIYKEYVNYGVPEQYARDLKGLIQNEQISVFFGDPSMFGDTVKARYTESSTAQIFRDEGIYLQPANNNRVDGWRVMKQWLHWTTSQKPMIRIFENCRYLIETIPTLTYDRHKWAHGEDLDTRQSDDAVDACRYLLLSGYGYPSHLERDLILEDTMMEERKREYYKETNLMKRFNDISGVQEWTPDDYSPMRKRTFHDQVFYNQRSYYG